MTISGELRGSHFGISCLGACFALFTKLVLVWCFLNEHGFRTKAHFQNDVDALPLSFSFSSDENEAFVFKQYDLVTVRIVTMSKRRVTLNIIAFGNVFCLHLKRDTSAFHPSARVYVKSGSKTEIKNPTDFNHLYTGKDAGEPFSYAQGSILNGMFDGTIHTSSEIFYVEPVERYLFTMDSLSEIDKTRHLVYRHADIVWNGTFSRKNIVDRLKMENYFSEKFLNNLTRMDHTDTKRADIYHSRNTRTANNPISCSLKVVVDHLFFKYIGGSDVHKTVAEIAVSVKEADSIFRSTDFNGNGKSDNLGFVITDLTLYTHKNTPGYKLGDTNLDDTEYLEQFSEYDFSSVCMAVSFTYRDFPDGVIGLAWVASSNWHSYPGGICQHRIYTYSKYYSFNTAMVSYLNHGIRMPRAKSISTLVHELGHSFGSPHDTDGDPQCAPGGELGNFIMYPYALDGTKPNHGIFSQCSLSSIHPVIVNKGGCLVSHPGPVCGNGIIETGEECDCGTSTSCHIVDHCCTPADSPPSYPDTPCSVRTSVGGYLCSPIASPCCDDSCQIVSAIANHSCQQSIDCSFQSFCDGVSSSCPKPDFKPNGTLCLENKRFCLLGECQSSLCHSIGLTDCMCTENDGLCSICCLTTTNKCVHISQFNVSSNFTGNFLALPGQPCKGYHGYCSIDGNCILVDTDSTIKRLAGMFGKDAAELVQHWLSSNWFYVLLGSCTLSLLLALFWANYKCYENVDVLAKRTGKLSMLLKEANRQKQAIQDKLSEIENVAGDDRHLNSRFDKVIAVSRLMLLFPDISTSEANKITHSVTDEEVAVRYLLMRKHAFIRILAKPNTCNQ